MSIYCWRIVEAEHQIGMKLSVKEGGGMAYFPNNWLMDRRKMRPKLWPLKWPLEYGATLGSPFPELYPKLSRKLSMLSIPSPFPTFLSKNVQNSIPLWLFPPATLYFKLIESVSRPKFDTFVLTVPLRNSQLAILKYGTENFGQFWLFLKCQTLFWSFWRSKSAVIESCRVLAWKLPVTGTAVNNNWIFPFRRPLNIH